MNAQSGAPDTRYLFAWIRASLGASIVVASAFYLATSLLALPLRQEADASLNQMLRKGEVALIRQQKL